MCVLEGVYVYKPVSVRVWVRSAASPLSFVLNTEWALERGLGDACWWGSRFAELPLLCSMSM